MEKRLKELMMQVEDERRHGDQYKEQVKFVMFLNLGHHVGYFKVTFRSPCTASTFFLSLQIMPQLAAFPTPKPSFWHLNHVFKIN